MAHAKTHTCIACIRAVYRGFDDNIYTEETACWTVNHNERDNDHSRCNGRPRKSRINIAIAHDSGPLKSKLVKSQLL